MNVTVGGRSVTISEVKADPVPLAFVAETEIVNDRDVEDPVLEKTCESVVAFPERFSIGLPSPQFTAIPVTGLGLVTENVRLTVEPVFAGFGVGLPTDTDGGKFGFREGLHAVNGCSSQPDQLWPEKFSESASQ